MRKIKIEFDIHGVITSNIEKYKKLMENLVESKLFEVWIISGPRTLPVINELNSYGIKHKTHYHFIDTVVEYLLRRNEDFRIEYSEEGVEHYYFDEYKWNSAKSNICETHKIDILIDDTQEYETYFDKLNTIFVLVGKE
jgi:hypothetical protein